MGYHHERSALDNSITSLLYCNFIAQIHCLKCKKIDKIPELQISLLFQQIKFLKVFYSYAL